MARIAPAPAAASAAFAPPRLGLARYLSKFATSQAHYATGFASGA